MTRAQAYAALTALHWRDALDVIRDAGRYFHFDETDEWHDALDEVEFAANEAERELEPAYVIDQTKGVWM